MVRNCSREPKDLILKAKANGYRRGAHIEEDQVFAKAKHVTKTMRDQDATLRRYVLWHLDDLQQRHAQQGLPPPNEVDARDSCLREGVQAPDLATVKDFLRFYIATSQPQLSDRPTVDSINTIAEWFFAGFTRVTGTDTNERERSEVYNWVRKVLTTEGLVINKRKPKYNFEERDLIRILTTLWTKDDLIFIPERYRIQFTFIIKVFCWTGARLGAFFTGGLRYRDIDLVLQRTSADRWRLIYKINQRWVKNNRDPENIVFGTAGREHEKFVYDDAALLLSMAILDNALFGYNTLADLRTQKIPASDNELVLRFEDSALDKPILRKCTMAHGTSDDPMPKTAFTEVFRTTLRNAGYMSATSVHAIRRQLGKKVDASYTEVQRSQHLTQADPRIFGQSYVANTSSVDGQGAFLGETLDHSHIEYFQGFRQFHESGLPCELPAHLEIGIMGEDEVKKLQEAVQQESYKNPTAMRDAKRELASHLKSRRRLVLREYQEQWVKSRRDWKIASRGATDQQDIVRSDLVRSMSLLIPERGRLAKHILSDKILSPEARWSAMDDIHALCSKDLSVLYLPQHQPVAGKCPVKCCQAEINSLPKTKRNRHIHLCVRRELASKHEYLQSEVYYCYHCFQWVLGRAQWEEHCGGHLQDLQSQTCGTMTYCHTLVRPGYCPFCLGMEELSNARRLESWSRDYALWHHITQHLRNLNGPYSCPHPLCNFSTEAIQQLRYHFIDRHGLSRTLPKENTSDFSAIGVERTSKRKSCDDLIWMEDEFPSHESNQKRPRRCSTVAPSSLLLGNDAIEDHPQTTSEAATSLKMNAPPSRLDDHKLEEIEQDSLSHPWISTPSEDYGSVMSATIEDVLFSQFMRSPSPDLEPGIHLATDGSQLPSNVRSSIHTDTVAGNNDKNLHLDADTACIANKVFTRACTHRQTLRLNPPKAKIVLRVANKSHGRQTAPKASQCKQSVSRTKKSRQHSKVGSLTKDRQRQRGRKKT